MDKLKQAGLNLGRVFTFRHWRTLAPCPSFITEKLTNLEWKNQPKQLLGYLPLAIALPHMEQYLEQGNLT